jgi:polyphosphate kinase 2 (PPK2 family)
VWRKRYGQINAFERFLSENHVRVVKFFLHISKDEQKERLEERLKDPNKHWKASLGDFKERQYWDEYQEAYEAALEKCSTKWAPWYIIPADRKWFRNLAVASILLDTMKTMEIRLPEAKFDLSSVVIE